MRSGDGESRPERSSAGVIGSLPPEPVRVFDPVALAGDTRQVVTASYFLPVSFREDAPGQVEWFRASVVYDLDREQEFVVLSRRDGASEAPLLGSVRMGLLDRLPFPHGVGRAQLRSALEDIRRRGHGAVRVHFDERDEAAGDDGAR